jgi:hypothetical protein
MRLQRLLMKLVAVRSDSLAVRSRATGKNPTMTNQTRTIGSVEIMNAFGKVRTGIRAATNGLDVWQNRPAAKMVL